MSKYRNNVFCDFKSRFLVILSSNYRRRLQFKILFPDHIFPKSRNTVLEIFISRPPANTPSPPYVDQDYSERTAERASNYLNKQNRFDNRESLLRSSIRNFWHQGSTTQHKFSLIEFQTRLVFLLHWILQHGLFCIEN